MKKVGKNYGTYSKPNIFTYKDIPYEEDEWADAALYYPADCDLMHLHLDTGNIIAGWICGTKWDGLRLKKHDTVLFWKRKPEGEE